MFIWVLFSIDHVIFLKVVVIVNVFMYWPWHSSLLRLENTRGMLRYGFVYLLSPSSFLNTSIYWGLLFEIGGDTKTIFYCPRATCPSRMWSCQKNKWMDHLSHNAENKVMQQRLRWISKIDSGRSFTVRCMTGSCKGPLNWCLYLNMWYAIAIWRGCNVTTVCLFVCRQQQKSILLKRQDRKSVV